MLGTILGFVLKLLGGNVVKDVLGYFERKADNDTERLRISETNRSLVMQSAMSHSMFWVAWGIAAVPMAAWFGWGMLDTLLNGALPNVAVIPPGLKPYAETVWSNIFWTGGVVATASVTGKTITNVIGSIFRAR